MEDKKIFILKNAGKLYLKHGIRGVTMDDIALEFGISKKTLYQFFRNKKDFVQQVVGFYLQNPEFRLHRQDSGNAIDRIFAVRKHVIEILKHYNNNLEFDLKKNYPELYKKVHQFKRERIFNDTHRNIEAGKKEGIFRPEIDPELIANLQVGRMLFVLNPENEIFTEDEISSIDLFDKIMDYHLHAICTEKGLTYYKQKLNKIQNEEQN